MWQSKVHPRVAFFFGTAALGKILTTNNLWKRHIAVLERCFMCKRCGESVDHLFFFISNKILLKRKKSHPRTQGVYKGEQIKNENYKSQENPKEIKKGFSKQRTIQVRFGKREA